MGLEDIDVSVEIVISRSDAHTGHLLAIAAHRHSTDQGLFAECSIVIVHKEQAWRGVGRNQDVRPAVFIHVERHCGKAIRSLGGFDSRRF